MGFWDESHKIHMKKLIRQHLQHKFQFILSEAVSLLPPKDIDTCKIQQILTYRSWTPVTYPIILGTLEAEVRRIVV
jgi:hypothetical protein